MIQISKFRERLAEQLLNLKGIVFVTPAGSSSPHHLVERTGSNRKRIRRTCSSSCAKKKKQEGRDSQRKMTQRSYTHCSLCPEQPQMCLKCFNEVHQRTLITRDSHFLWYVFQIPPNHSFKYVFVITTFCPFANTKAIKRFIRDQASKPSLDCQALSHIRYVRDVA